jgi:hypothetical protein
MLRFTDRGASSQVDRQLIRAQTPGEVIHVDVMKLGLIPDGDGWKSDPNRPRSKHKSRSKQVGFDFHRRRHQ